MRRLWISGEGRAKSFGPFAADTVPTIRSQRRAMNEGFFHGWTATEAA